MNTGNKAKYSWKGILIVPFLFLTSNVIPQDYYFRNFNLAEGLAYPYVYSIDQDSSGYLWIGTGNGLSRFNGLVFENYTTTDSLADNFISCSISDGEYMFFGHMNGSLSFFDGRKMHPVRLPEPGLSHITHFAKSPDGQIWASTYSDGLLLINRTTNTAMRYVFKDQIFIISFEFIESNELLIGTNTGLIHCRLKEPDEVEIIKSVAEIAETKVSCIMKMHNKNGFYLATENEGLFKMTYDKNLFNISEIITDPRIQFTGIQDIYEDTNSNLWLGSFGYGLIKLTNSSDSVITKFSYFNKAGGFATDNVKSLFVDREGNIWSGNYGEGLTQIMPKVFSVISFDKAFYGNNIFSIYFNEQYSWTGTENGLIQINRLDNKIEKFYSKGIGLPKDTVTAIFSSDGKEIWIGTEKNGLFRMETGNEKILKYPIGEGELENSITAITGKGEEFWIGTKKGLCNINSRIKKIKWYSINQGGLPHNLINSLYIDRAGILWICTRSNILSYIADSTVFKIPIYSGSGLLTLNTVTEDMESRIWVGSNGQGVFLIGSDSITNLTVKEGLFSNYCYSIICDDNKNIWIGHKGGLSRIRTSDFSVKPLQPDEGTKYNYQFNPNAILNDQQEKIWFGSDNGLIVYDPSREHTRLLPPVLRVTSIKINDEERDYSDKIILAPGNYKIKIDFLGISLKEPELVTYQHKLENYDQWSEITKNTSITYNHLTEGNYTFILKASSGDGTVSENPLTLNIIIKKPVWKQWWFYLTSVFLLISMTYVFIKRREHKFIVEKQILEEKVRERTYEIECQKNEIEKQRDVINEKNENITSSIKYASHIQNAILPANEHISKLLPPEYFILSKPKDIVSGDFYWIAEKDNKIVIAIADCTGHGVPGAFMSILGITLLNEIVNIQGTTQSEIIVTRLREEIILSLQQSRKDITTLDGIDLVLCVLDQPNKRIQYTGAMNDLVYIREKKLEEIKANPVSASVLLYDEDPFTMNEIYYRTGDVFYMFTDGYKDQLGGEEDKKFSKHRFYETLLEIHGFSMSDQKEILEKRLNEWKKDTIQTDDITVMGIRF